MSWTGPRRNDNPTAILAILAKLPPPPARKGHWPDGYSTLIATLSG